MIAKARSVFTAAENPTMTASGMSLANHCQIDDCSFTKTQEATVRRLEQRRAIKADVLFGS